jgi:hypothetical protein
VKIQRENFNVFRKESLGGNDGGFTERLKSEDRDSCRDRLKTVGGFYMAGEKEEGAKNERKASGRVNECPHGHGLGGLVGNKNPVAQYNPVAQHQSRGTKVRHTVLETPQYLQNPHTFAFGDMENFKQ